MDDYEDDLMGVMADSVTMEDLLIFDKELNPATLSEKIKKAPTEETQYRHQERQDHHVMEDDQLIEDEKPATMYFCSVCASSDRGMCKAWGLQICEACRVFIWKFARFKTPLMSCQTGLFDCDITKRSKHNRVFCRACRLKKCFALGLNHPSLRGSFEDYILPEAASPNRSHSQEDPLKYSATRPHFSTTSATATATSNPTLSSNSRTNVTQPTKSSLGPKDRSLEGKVKRKICCICETKNQVSRYLDILVCTNCRSFVAYYVAKKKFNLNCVTGLRDCNVTGKPMAGERHTCSGCRLRKAINEGLNHPAIPSVIRNGQPSSDATLNSSRGSSGSQQTQSSGTSPPKGNENMTPTASGPSRARDADYPGRTELSEQTTTPKEAHSSRKSLYDGKKCQICSRGKEAYLMRYHGIVACCACKNFLWTLMNRRIFEIECITGLKNCTIKVNNEKSYPPSCRGCRLRIAIEQGFQHPVMPVGIASKQPPPNSSMSDNTSQVEDNIESLEDRSALGSRLCCICDHNIHVYFADGLPFCENCQSFAARIIASGKTYKCKGNNDCDISRRSIRRVKCKACRWTKIAKKRNLVTTGKSTEPVKRADKEELVNESELTDEDGTIEDDKLSLADEPIFEEPVKVPEFRILTASELEVGIDSHGLPLDIARRFSRWLYADFENFKPGSSKSKIHTQDVKPRPPDRVITISNSIENHFAYLTRNLNREKAQEPIEQLCDTVMEIVPSIKLLRAHAASFRRESAPEERSAKKRRPYLTLVLETKRTMVDRRPMLERNRNLKGYQDDIQTSQGHDAADSLIGPGENCDDAEEDHIVEIDCDDGTAVVRSLIEPGEDCDDDDDDDIEEIDCDA